MAHAGEEGLAMLLHPVFCKPDPAQGMTDLGFRGLEIGFRVSKYDKSCSMLFLLTFLALESDLMVDACHLETPKMSNCAGATDVQLYVPRLQAHFRPPSEACARPS